MAKKKMTKAQAASARKELTQQDKARKQIRERDEEARAAQNRAKEQKKKSPVFSFAVGIGIVLVIALCAWIVSVGPGMFMSS